MTTLPSKDNSKEKMPMRLKTISILLLATAPLFIGAAPATAPSPQNAPTTQPSRAGLHALRHEFREVREPTEEEWKEIEAFMEEHSPYRLDQIQKMKETAPMRSTLRARIAQQYRNLKDQQRDDQPLYDISLKRFELKDQQFHLAQELFHAPKDQKPALRQQLRDNAEQLVDLNLREREYRINKLTATLNHERDKLAQDKGNKDQLVNEQLRQAAVHDQSSRRPTRTTTAEAQ